MSTTAVWAPNQSAIAQVETYTFTVPSGVGNTYSATINGKVVTYTSVSGDTAATVATALLAALQASPVPELAEVTFANPSTAVLTATAKSAGTPFANVTVGSVTGQGLVLSTGNGLSNGIATAHTQANQSPSDANDPQNWLRITAPAAGVRQLPQSGDDFVIANTSVPMLWNLDQLRSVAANTYTRWQSFTGTVGLPENNPNGYVEWRPTYLWLLGPAGSVPAGGLPVVLGFSSSGSGGGPTRERYNLQSQKYTCQAIAAGSPVDEYGIRLLGVHTDNAIVALGGVSVGVATLPGEVSKLNTVTLDGGATVAVGVGVTWTTSSSGTPSSMTTLGGSTILNSAPATLTLAGGTGAAIATDALTWTAVVLQGGSTLTCLAGGTITTLTMTTGSTLDKSQDGRSLVITNHTIDGDTCTVVDPLNAITFTNAGTVKQSVTSGPYQFTGSRTVKVT